ncbi:deoxyribonuclease IV [Candidatus Bipolaricaulota bacterium]|nr:deoxyribonuclease IV [Candidatus Bipolaricaulota bacterium]
MLLGAHMSIAGGIDSSVDRAADFEMNALQIFSHNVRSWDTRELTEEEIEGFKKKREEFGVDYAVVHTSYLLNLASPKEDLWEKSKKGLVEEIRRAHLLDIPAINTHIGAHTGSGLETGIDRLVEALKEIETTDVFENSSVKVLLENTAGEGTKLGSDFAELGEVLDKLDYPDRYGVCIDTCHGFAAGYDFATEAGLEETLEEFDREVGLNKLDLIHLNDSVGERGLHKDRHTHIGRGEIGNEGFAAVVNHPDTRKLPFILETPKEKLDGIEADRVNLDKVMDLRE